MLDFWPIDPGFVSSKNDRGLGISELNNFRGVSTNRPLASSSSFGIMGPENAYRLVIQVEFLSLILALALPMRMGRICR